MTSLRFCLIFWFMSLQVWKANLAPADLVSFTTEAATTTVITPENAFQVTHQDDKRGKRNLEVPPPEILRFMRRFGYLEPNPSDSESLYHESAIVEAIKNIQKYGALNQTGTLDNETLELFNKPRCGVPDIEGIPYYLASSTQRLFVKRESSDSESREGSRRVRDKRYVVGAPTWKKRRIRYLIANWSLKIPKEQIVRDTARAFALWAQYSGLRFERVNDTNADIIVGFGTRYHGDNFPFDGPGNILAHAYYPYEMGSWGGDVHFDEDENWKENSTDLVNGVDFYAVAAHEIGHSLGLAHSPHYSSIMFPYYKGPGAGTTLDYDDTLAMYSIYLTKVLEDDQAGETASEVSQTTETAAHVDEGAYTTPASTTSSWVGDKGTVDQERNDSTSPASEVVDTTISTTLTTTTPSRTTPELSKFADICQGKFDAVSVLNGTIHIFKNENVYKLTTRYTIMNGYPLSIYELFPFLPADIKRIDAAYERYDGAGVFFTGTQYWVFNYTQNMPPTLLDGNPFLVANLIGTTTNVDAAMMWPKNNLTYIFTGSQFWRFNDRLQHLDDGYPKSIRRWPGIPNNIDAAATLQNGKTYFFKANLYWLYDNVRVRPMRGYPRRASSAWLGCVAVTTKRPLRNTNTTVTFIAPST